MCIRSFLAIVCTKEGEVVRKGRIKTDETAIKEFFYGLRDVKVAIEASTNYSYIVDALVKADLAS
ncbi:MAG: hypothetical protein DRN11_01655 [Thermoplasmata archaeon]|nr:MAG: hypothetical protein DRN11_01655 [Thermoplasmata archaeon]